MRPVSFVQIAAGVVLAASIVGCGGDQSGGGGGFAMPPTPVEVAEVVQGTIEDRFRAVGTIEAAEAIVVVSEINGAVKRLPFREGEFIAAGGLIAQLDDAELRADMARAQALEEQARSNFERVRLVVEKKAAAPQDLDDAAASLHVAEANLELARARLEKTRIVAPFSGYLGARRVSPGAFLRVGDPITDLAQISKIKIRFTAPERFVPRLEPEALVEVSTTAYPGESLTGRIDVVSPVVDAATRSVLVIARAGNPGGRFRPGMSADVSVVLGRRPDALTIPGEAVFAQGAENLVYVVGADSTVVRTSVALGLRLPGSVEIVSGLEPGMQVVRAGHQKLFDGARVMPISSRPPGDQVPGDEVPGDEVPGDEVPGAETPEATASREGDRS
jgi:membrane fusion protein (multidrug efflux system)